MQVQPTSVMPAPILSMRPPLRLAYIVGAFPLPSETFIAREIAGLRARGHQVSVFSLFAPASGMEDGIAYAWASTAARARHKLAPALALRELASRWHITRHDFDIAIAQFVSFPATAALQVVDGDVPLLISAHARDLYVEAGALEDKLARAAALVTCTRANVAYLGAHYPHFAHKIHLIYHGLPADWLTLPIPSRTRASGEPLHILAAGRFVEKKGFATLLAACARLHFPYTLLLVGEGTLRAALLRQRDQLGLRAVVSLPGWLNETALRAAYAAADLCCCPSCIAADGDRDGLPNVLLEAQSTGLPAIGANISAIPEAIIDNETGFLMPAADPIALAAAITRLADPALRNMLGARAAVFVRERFSQDNWLSKLEALLYAEN
jgi:glycosyltransferase involved in cell wall biosynthesis